MSQNRSCATFCIRNTYTNDEVQGDVWLHRCDGVYTPAKKLRGDQVDVFGEQLTFKSQKVFQGFCPQCLSEGYTARNNVP